MAQLLARHGIDVPVIEREERLYAGAARNIGIGATRAPHVAFLASDCMATTGWARARIAAHSAGAAAVGSAVLNGSPRNPFAWAGHLSLWWRAPCQARPRPRLWRLLRPRRLFETHGFFREDSRGRRGADSSNVCQNAQGRSGTAAIHTIHRNPTRVAAAHRRPVSAWRPCRIL